MSSKTNCSMYTVCAGVILSADVQEKFLNENPMLFLNQTQPTLDQLIVLPVDADIQTSVTQFLTGLSIKIFARYMECKVKNIEII